MNFHFLPRWASLLIRYALGVAIVYWLMRNQTLDASHIITLSLPFVVAGILLILFQLFLSSLRVRMLLYGQGIDVSLRHCFQFNTVGIFYSTFLPGGISGDIARAYFFWKEYPYTSKSSMMGALFLDRLVGLVMMIFIGLVAVTFMLDSKGLMTNYVAAGWILFVTGSVFYIWLGHNLVFDANLIPEGRWGKLGFLLRKLVSKIHLENYLLPTIGAVMLISLTIHVSTVVMIYLLSLHVGSGLSFVQVTAVTPVGLLVNALPISPGGLGVGEKSFDMLFAMVGGGGGGNAFLIARVFLYLPALIGGLIVLRSFLKAHHFGK